MEKRHTHHPTAAAAPDRTPPHQPSGMVVVGVAAKGGHQFGAPQESIGDLRAPIGCCLRHGCSVEPVLHCGCLSARQTPRGAGYFRSIIRTGCPVVRTMVSTSRS